MTSPGKFLVGTSGYSFADWVGPFYPPGTRGQDMFAHYVQHFRGVELNFTYYRMPSARTLERLADASPPNFVFWVKANRETTHKLNRGVAGEFVANLAPLREAGKLGGVLMQFPQSFHRTVASRKYLAAALGDFASLPVAVEFRHRSWDHPCVTASLKERAVTLVVPDVPPLVDLYHAGPAVTSRTGYLRLHSRRADAWYAGGAQRYDYDYSSVELGQILDDWSSPAAEADRVYAFFNNCHRGQAARNAEAFQRLVENL